MAFVIKFVKTVRNNWKKSVLFTGVGLWGANYMHGIYEDSLTRQEFCRLASEFGKAPLRTGERPRKVTVFLNPAANTGKGRSLFDKNAAPILYIAGLQVTVVKTEYEGQAKKYMDVIEDVDAILVAGGDGTLSEVITGLLRRGDEFYSKNIPIGVIPVGQTNSLGKRLFNKGKSDARWLAEAAYAVVVNTTKPVDVMQIQGEGSKVVYALAGLEWGPFKDAEERKKKYWYFGPLKHRITYAASCFSNWPPAVKAKLSYTLPCDGCSKCYVAPPQIQWKWWHFLLAPPKTEVPKKDYSSVTNDLCGTEFYKEVDTLDFEVKTQNVIDSSKQDDNGLQIRLAPAFMGKIDFIKEGWNRLKGRPSGVEKEEFNVKTFCLRPQTTEDKEEWFTIDSELYETMPIEVNLLKNKIRMFCNVNTQPS